MNRTNMKQPLHFHFFSILSAAAKGSKHFPSGEAVSNFT